MCISAHYLLDVNGIELRKRVIQLILSFGLFGLLRQIRDSLTAWLDNWVLRTFRVRCPRCLYTKLWRDGHERRKNRCPIQKFKCTSCGKKCCVNTFAPWYWHKYDAATILGFLWVKNKFGYGLIECAKHVCLTSRLPTWKTLWSWLQKFGVTIVHNAARVKKKVSRYRAWQSDEMYIRNRPIIGTVDPHTNTILFTPAWYANKETINQHQRTVLSHWRTTPRGWWTDEHKAYPPSFENLPQQIPHGTVCHAKQYRSSRGVCTNAIENQWRQYRRWLFRINGINNQAYVAFYTSLYEMQRNVLNAPLDMLQLLA